MPVSVGELLAYMRLDSSGFDRGIRVAQTEMRTATGTADRMGAAVGTTSDRLTGAGRAAQVAASGSAKYRAAQLSLVAAQERYNAVLNQGDASAGRLASAEASVIRANERVAASSRSAAAAVAGLGAAERRGNAAAAATPGLMARTASGMSGAARSAVGLGAAFGVFELARKAIDIGKDAAKFQQSMLLIQTNANAGAAEVKSMTDAVLKMSPEVATKPLDLANALYHVEQNGLRGGKALEALRAGAEGAKIGMADVEDTTNTMTIAVASGIDGMGNLQKAMGTMIAIAGTGDMHLKDLNEALSGGILSVAKGYGASLQDVAAVLATLGDNGTRGADAATALRQTMMGFAQPAAKGKAALDSVGLSMTSLRDDMQKHGLVHAMNDLEQHMIAAGITGSKVGAFITEVFGKKAGAGLAVLLGQMDRVNAKFDEGKRGAASFADKWNATTKTAAFAFQKLGATIEAAGIKAAGSAMPTFTRLAQDIGAAMPAALHAASGALAPFGVAWHLLAATLGIAGGALRVVGDVLGAMGPEIKVVGGLLAGLWLGFKAGELAVALMTAVKSAMDGLALRAMYAKDAVVGFWSGQAVAADAAAAESATAATVVAASADEAAASVGVAGAEAEAGWAGLAGPFAAAAVGVAVLVSMFHHSSSASKEATDAAKAYSEALKGSKADLADSITKQLSNNKVPEAIKALNKDLGSVTFNGRQFFTAIRDGGKPLADLRSHLQDVINAGTHYSAAVGRGASVTGSMSVSARVATKLLKDLNDQYSGLTAAARKDLADTKAFAGVSSSIDKVSQSTKVASDTAKKYAEMMGITVDKNGIAAVSASVLKGAVERVSKAYNTATASGSEFLAALNTFSQSAGTAADRAALIGATLKANAGDALDFAAAMNATVTANHQLGIDVKQTASQITKGGESTRAYLRSIVDLKTGTIDYHRTASGPLISDLQTIQSNAIQAAVATYQHNRALMGGKAAADTAVAGYVGVERSLEGQLRKLGLTKDAAQKLTEKYLGVPKNVRTAIQQEGANPIVSVLNRIGQLLANLTGQTWDIGVNVIVDKIINATAGVKGTKNSDPRLSGRASGGGLPEGVSSVGEQGAELAVKNGPNVQILSHSQSKAYLAKTGMKAPGFASGTLNPHSFLTSLGKDASSEKYAFQQILAVGTKAGISSGLAKELTAENKRLDAAITVRNRLADKLKNDNQRLADAQKRLADEASAVKGAITGSFDVTTAGAGFDGQQPITGRNMVAEERQAANRARAFVAAIKKLKGKIGAGYLYQLAEKGPGALPEAQALLSLKKSDLSAFNSAAVSLNTSGNQLGGFIGNMRFGASVRTDKATVAADRARLRKENQSIERLGNRIVKQLEHGIEHLSHPKITVYLDGKKIATAVAHGAKKNGVRS